MANKSQAAQGQPDAPTLKEVFTIHLSDNVGRNLGSVDTGHDFPAADLIAKTIEEAREIHQLQVFAKVDKRYTL